MDNIYYSLLTKTSNYYELQNLLEIFTINICRTVNDDGDIEIAKRLIWDTFLLRKYSTQQPIINDTLNGFIYSDDYNIWNLVKIQLKFMDSCNYYSINFEYNYCWCYFNH